MRRFLMSVVMCVAVSAAQAADLSDLPILRGAYTEGLTTSKVNWQGVYVGGQGGVGTSEMNFTGVTQPLASRLLANTAIENFGGIAELPLGSRTAVHGDGFGAFVGYNSQWDDIILGVEFNYLHGKFGGSQTDTSAQLFFGVGGGATDSATSQSIASVSISDMATLRARAGYSWGVFLPYVFGGVALAHADIVRTARVFGDQSVPPLDFPFDVRATDAQNNRLVFGYSGGLGMDVMLMSCLFLRAEWEYVRLATVIDTNVNTFKAGLGYKF
jgi:outer membrane immunogenic protein